MWLVQLSSSCGAPGGRAAHQQHCTSIGLWWRAAWPRGRCACWPVGECLAWWMPAGGGCCILRRLQLAQTSRQVESRERRISVCFELPTRAERETLRRPDGSDVLMGRRASLDWHGAARVADAGVCVSVSGASFWRFGLVQAWESLSRRGQRGAASGTVARLPADRQMRREVARRRGERTSAARPRTGGAAPARCKQRTVADGSEVAVSDQVVLKGSSMCGEGWRRCLWRIGRSRERRRTCKGLPGGAKRGGTTTWQAITRGAAGPRGAAPARLTADGETADGG